MSVKSNGAQTGLDATNDYIQGYGLAINGPINKITGNVAGFSIYEINNSSITYNINLKNIQLGVYNAIITENVYGSHILGANGNSSNANATSNVSIFEINNSTLGTSENNVFANYINIDNENNINGSLNANTQLVNISDSTINAFVAGSYVSSQNSKANANLDRFYSNEKTQITGAIVGAYANSNNADASATLSQGQAAIVDGKFVDGSQNDNALTLHGSQVSGVVYGTEAKSDNGNANASSGNIFIGYGASVGQTRGAYANANKTANASTTILALYNGITINGEVLGSLANSSTSNANATTTNFIISNKIDNINNNQINGNVYGANAKGKTEANAINNLTYITDTKIGGSLNGANAITTDGNANASIDGNFTFARSEVANNFTISNANSINGSATSKVNNVFIVNSNLNQNDFVASSGKGDINAIATLNFLGIYNGSEHGIIKGAVASSDGVENAATGTLALNGNKDIEGIQKAQNIVNGDIFASIANSNSSSATASTGWLIVDNSLVTGDIYGSSANVTTGSEQASAKIDNILLTDSAKLTGDIFGASAINSGNGNSLTNLTLMDINSSTISGNIYGANAIAQNGAAINDKDTTLQIHNGAAITGDIYAINLEGNSATSTSSLINIQDASITGDIYGANAKSANANISNNEIYLADANINGDIYGGFINGNGISNKNIVTLDGVTFVEPNTKIYGSSGSNSIEGNTFNFSANQEPITVAQLKNFDTWNIQFKPKDQLESSTLFTNDKSLALIKVTEEIGNDLEVKTTVNLYQNGMTLAQGKTLKDGDKMYIVDASDANVVYGNNNNAQMSDVFQIGNGGVINIGMIYDANVQVGQGDDQTIYAEIKNNENNNNGNNPGGNNPGGNDSDNPFTPPPIKPPETNPDDNITVPSNPLPPEGPNPPVYEKNQDKVDKLKPILEGNLAGLMAVNAGADLGIRGIYTILEPTKLGEIIPFGTFEGYHDKYSKAHTKNNGYNFVVGHGYSFDESVIGWFFEYGKSHYKTHNTYSAVGNLSELRFKGRGNTTHYGIGMLGKKYFDDFYLETSVRYGKVKNDFSTSSWTKANYGATNPDFNTQSNYWGGHLGTGYIYKANDTNKFDTSLRYIHAEVQKSHATLDESKVNFNKMKSNRIQVGEEYTYDASKYLSLVASGTYEYEFSGKAKGNIDGYDIKSATMKGSTGIGTLGVMITPFNGGDKNKTIDLGVSGYSGARKGISGNIGFKYNF